MNKFVSGFFAFALLSTFLYYTTWDWNKYVSSTTWVVCYAMGHEPKRIKRKVYHETLKECESYIINFQ